MDKSDILFEEYYEDVMRFPRGLSRDEYLAEELTQETICRAIRSIDTFKGDSDLRIGLPGLMQRRVMRIGSGCWMSKISGSSFFHE